MDKTHYYHTTSTTETGYSGHDCHSYTTHDCNYSSTTVSASPTFAFGTSSQLLVPCFASFMHHSSLDSTQTTHPPLPTPAAIFGLNAMHPRRSPVPTCGGRDHSLLRIYSLLIFRPGMVLPTAGFHRLAAWYRTSAVPVLPPGIDPTCHIKSLIGRRSSSK